MAAWAADETIGKIYFDDFLRIKVGMKAVELQARLGPPAVKDTTMCGIKPFAGGIVGACREVWIYSMDQGGSDWIVQLTFIQGQLFTIEQVKGTINYKAK